MEKRPKFREIKQIGIGRNSKVFLVQGEDGINYAAKKIDFSKNRSLENRVIEEVEVMRKISHPNIINFYDSFYESNPSTNYVLIFEYMENGTLLNLIQEMKRSKKKFSEKKILDYFIQLALALYHIHNRGIIHRDIKPSNIFISKTNQLKLGDFALSRNLDFENQKVKSYVGTLEYQSPELQKKERYRQKTDIWSLGVTLYQIITYDLPFHASYGGQYDLMLGKIKPIKDDYSPELKNLVLKLLQVNVDSRPSAREILGMLILIILII